MTRAPEMNDSPRSQPADDWLDALLRADGRDHRADYLDDDGFTARVAAALPASPAALPAWRKPAVAALWAAGGIGVAFALPGAASDAAHEIIRAILAQRVSAGGIGTALVVLLASAWTAVAVVLRGD